MKKSKYKWADYTWNPITGCLAQCDNCKNKDIMLKFCGDIRYNISKVKRNAENEELFVLEKPFVTGNKGNVPYPFGTAPTLHQYRLEELQKSTRNGSNILVCTKGDMFGDWIPDEWVDNIFQACLNQPRHNYLFITKNPDRYLRLAKNNKLPSNSNMWYGTKISNDKDSYFFSEKYNCFLYIEETENKFKKFSENSLEKIKWIITQTSIDNVNQATNDLKISFYIENGDKKEMPTSLSAEKPLTEAAEKQFKTLCMECKIYGKKGDMNSVTIRKGRRGTNKTIGYLCDTCYNKLLDKWGVDIGK